MFVDKTLRNLVDPIQGEIDFLNLHMLDIFEEDQALSEKVAHYAFRRKGKQIRPILTFLSAAISGGVKQSTYRMAQMVEMVHVASLLHDDVVDNSDVRRGEMSAKKRWSNKVAVLGGDYILSAVMSEVFKKDDPQVIGIITDVIREMSKGELRQLELEEIYSMDEETYFEVIKAKTARLISASCRLGAISAKPKKESYIDLLTDLGLNIGMAFQLKDDLLDFEFTTGKDSFSDLRNGKVTLPLIFALKKTSEAEAAPIIELLKIVSKSEQELKRIHRFMVSKGGIAYTQKKMQEYYQKADNLLNKFPDNTYKRTFKNIIQYIVERDS